MKSISLVFILFLSFTASASELPFVSGTIDSVFCGEVDPFLGEACVIVVLDENNQKKGLYFEGYQWIDINAPSYDFTALHGAKVGAFFCEALSGEAEALQVSKVLKSAIDADADYLSCYANDFVYL